MALIRLADESGHESGYLLFCTGCGCRIDLSTDPPEGHRQWLRTPKADYCRRCLPGDPGATARPTVPLKAGDGN